jgi:hypothetical protein
MPFEMCSLKSLDEVENVLVNVFIAVSSPHVVEVVVVSDNLALSRRRHEVNQLGIIIWLHEGIIGAGNEEDGYVGKVRLEAVRIVERRGALAVFAPVGICRTVVKLLEAARAHHLDPVEKILRRRASNIILSHHGQHPEVEVEVLVEADHCLDEVPDETRE